ncbi:hypothetical protein IAT38_007788 [Cryptococcus sp. DSM 104549]
MPKDTSNNPRRRGRPPHQYKIPARADAPAPISGPAATLPPAESDASTSAINSVAGGQQDFSALLPPIDPDLMQRVLDPVQHEPVDTLSEFERRELAEAESGGGGGGGRHDQDDRSLQPEGYYASGIAGTSQGDTQALYPLPLPVSTSQAQPDHQPPTSSQPPAQTPSAHVESSTRVTHPLDETRNQERQALWDIVASCDYLPGTPADARGDLSEAKLNGLEGKDYALTTNNGFVKPTRQKKLEGDDYFRETISIEDIPRFFDSLPHDYNILSRARASCHFYITWLDPPGLIPTDIRSRHMCVSVDANALRNNPNGYIYRIIYKCSGSCMRVDSGAEAGGSYEHGHQHDASAGHQHDASAVPTDGDAGTAGGQAAAQPDEGARPRAKGQAVCDSLLMLEITCRMAANGQCAVVRKRPEYHPEGPASTLRMSAYMRSVLHELVMETGMPDKRLRVEYEERLCRASYAAWLERELTHRAPRPRHYNSVISAITRNKLGKSAPVMPEGAP